MDDEHYTYGEIRAMAEDPFTDGLLAWIPMGNGSRVQVELITCLPRTADGRDTWWVWFPGRKRFGIAVIDTGF